VQLKRSELDAVSRAYLCRVEVLKGSRREEIPGVFVPTRRGVLVGPRAGWELLLIVGPVLLVVALVAGILVPGQPRANLNWSAPLIAVTGALGLLCLASGVIRFRRPEPPGPVGNFVFADSSRLWEVRDCVVHVYEYADDLTATGEHYFPAGSAPLTQIVVRSGTGVHVLLLPLMLGSGRVVQFLNAVGQLRRLEEPTFRELAASGSAQVGLVALCGIDNRRVEGVSFDALTDSPRPSPEPSGRAEPTWNGAVGRGLVASVVALGLFFALRPMFDGLREGHLFTAVEADPAPSVAALDRYLAEYPNERRASTVRKMRDERVFALVPRPIVGAAAELPALERYLTEHPDGPHAAEARDLIDDHHFAVAEQTARAQDSPAGLRRYLAVPANTRHRAAAVAQIGTYYDRTVAELKKRATDNPDKIDRALMDPLVVLIGALKGVNDPVVTVGFVAELQTDPKTDAEKERERADYDIQLREEPALKDVAARSATNTAILPYLQAFEPDQVANREKLIYERLADAVRKAIKTDILTLRPARSDEQPMIEVRYKIVPSGSLYLYTTTGGFPLKTVNGLIRGYSIKWDIVMRPPGAAEPLRLSVASQPLSSLNYERELSDPEWAPYAILLYSAFYNLSDRMIRAFALDPGPPPNAFTFSATASTKPESVNPFEAFKQLANPPPKWRIDPRTGKFQFEK
jgi:hypothetical protein